MISEIREQHFETDVLILGSGSAGLWAGYAIKQKDPTVKVFVVDKGPKNWGGLMSCAGGDLDIVMPNEDVNDWVKDWVYYYDGLCDQELMETVFKDTYSILQQYRDWGCEYLTDKEGRIDTVGIPQRGLDHIKLYVTKIKGSGGLRMTSALAKAATQAGVESIGRTTLTDLVKNKDGRIVGAVGFNTIDGSFVTIKAKAVLLATGWGGWKSSYMKNPNTGEGIRMAFRAGAEIRNMEFARVWNVPKLFGWEGQTTLLPLGARFVNAKGEDFMKYYSNKFGSNTDPHYITIGMALEMRAGRGPIYMDTTGLKEEDEAAVKPKMGWQYLNYNRLVDLGIDFFKQKTEWMPQPLACYGGLVADLNGATKVQGLYAAGRCRSIDPGVYTGGFALASTATTGIIAGKAMVDYIKGIPLSELDSDEVRMLKAQLYSPMNNGGVNSKEVLRVIQTIVYPYEVSIIKSDASLKSALYKLETLKGEVMPLMGATDPHYLMKLKEVEAIAFITEWYIRASLMRTESRCGHFREDYPDHRDEWLKWIVVGLEGDKSQVHPVDVPIKKYKNPIERYYQDDFKFVQ